MDADNSPQLGDETDEEDPFAEVHCSSTTLFYG